MFPIRLNSIESANKFYYGNKIIFKKRYKNTYFVISEQYKNDTFIKNYFSLTKIEYHSRYLLKKHIIAKNIFIGYSLIL